MITNFKSYNSIGHPTSVINLDWESNKLPVYKNKCLRFLFNHKSTVFVILRRPAKSSMWDKRKHHTWTINYLWQNTLEAAINTVINHRCTPELLSRRGNKAQRNSFAQWMYLQPCLFFVRLTAVHCWVHQYNFVVCRIPELKMTMMKYIHSPHVILKVYANCARGDIF